MTPTTPAFCALNGGNIVFNKVTNAPAPRAGESYVIARQAGGISGTFGTTYTFQGVLRPELTYSRNYDHGDIARRKPGDDPRRAEPDGDRLRKCAR